MYRKYRPQTFAEIVGQEHISETLLKQLQNGSFTHAYLFSGPRGTGKTSTARVFAKALNCKEYKENKFGEPCNSCDNCTSITNGSYMDVIEIDAASNRGIDEIRDLREKINLSPTVGKYKVYIIDEVHMLTNEAFNALLKTLEEPPKHAIFILATTESHKIPATILSRTQRFDFARPTQQQVAEKLERIVGAEKWKIAEESLLEIAKVADGTFRDAEVMLDKISSVNDKASAEEVRKLLGKRDLSLVLDLIKLMLAKDTKGAFLLLEEFINSGGNVKVFTENLLETLRDILLIKVGALEKSSKFSKEIFAEIGNFSSVFPKTKLTKWINLFTESLIELKDSPIPSLPLELAIVEACDFDDGLVEVSLPKQQTMKQEAVSVVEPETAEEAETVPAPEIKEKIEELVQEVPVVKISKKSEFKIDDLLGSWSKVVEKVKEQNNSLSVFLRGATPIGFEDNIALVEVSYRFHKDRLEEPKNSEILSSIISELLGRDVRIKGVVGEKKERPKKNEAPIEEVDPVEIFGKLT